MRLPRLVAIGLCLLSACSDDAGLSMSSGLTLTPDMLNFREVPRGQRWSLDAVAKNVGPTVLHLQPHLFADGTRADAFELDSPASFTLEPGASQSLRIAYTANGEAGALETAELQLSSEETGVRHARVEARTEAIRPNRCLRVELRDRAVFGDDVLLVSGRGPDGTEGIFAFEAQTGDFIAPFLLENEVIGLVQTDGYESMAAEALWGDEILISVKPGWAPPHHEQHLRFSAKDGTFLGCLDEKSTPALDLYPDPYSGQLYGAGLLWPEYGVGGLIFVFADPFFIKLDIESTVDGQPLPGPYLASENVAFSPEGTMYFGLKRRNELGNMLQDWARCADPACSTISVIYSDWPSDEDKQDAVWLGTIAEIKGRAAAFGSDGLLYASELGRIHRFDFAQGSYTRIEASGRWEGFRSLAALGDRIYALVLRSVPSNLENTQFSGIVAFRVDRPEEQELILSEDAGLYRDLLMIPR